MTALAQTNYTFSANILELIKAKPNAKIVTVRYLIILLKIIFINY